ncbi:hypothetical protein BsWGS_03892 [Bradybaena similaris]
MRLLSLVGGTHALSVVGVFMLWTLTSFLCHEFAKIFLNISRKLIVSTDDPNAPLCHFYIAVVITVIQCTSGLALIRTDKDIWQTRGMKTLITSHVLATLANNYSMVFIEAACTLAIKFLEPVTMAIANRVAFQRRVPLQTIISMPLIMFGALTFTAHKTSTGFNAAGIFLALASNVILAVRNITMKKIQSDPSAKSLAVLKRWSHVALVVVVQGLFVAGLYHLEVREVVPSRSSKMVAFALASGMFHVAYTYISIGVVLQVMNVVSHSIANIFKRLLVVLLLSALGTRHVTASNFLGLGLAVAGLMVYTYGKITTGQQPCGKVEDGTKHVSIKHKTRFAILFLAVLSVVCFISFGAPVWINTAMTSARHGPCSQLTVETHSLFEGTEVRDNFAHITDAEADPEMREFLSWRLVDHPEDTDKRSKTLTTSREIVEEAQRILVNLMRDLIGNATHVMLIVMEVLENKGDPALAAGEVLLLEALNKTIVFHCSTSFCKQNLSLEKAKEVSKRYPMGDLSILMHGGGNLVGYPYIDRIRRRFLDAFPERQFIQFSQSIWLHGNYTRDLEFARETYSNRTNLVMLLRDRQSLEIAKENFKGVKLILAPDMAFCIGMKPRQMPPLYDIVWLQRDDNEKLHYDFPKIPDDITVDVGDWFRWRTNTGNRTLENVFLYAAAGLQFLQRGRVVVTERLHGHILTMFLGIPHVLLDNPPYLKLSSFHRTWTQGLDNTILVSNASLAMDAALELLKRYNNSLPSLSYKDMFVVT